MEILVVNDAVANLIRQGKTHQIASAMATGQKLGNTLLNAELAKLVAAGKVDWPEALAKTPDKQDLARRCNRPYDPQ